MTNLLIKVFLTLICFTLIACAFWVLRKMKKNELPPSRKLRKYNHDEYALLRPTEFYSGGMAEPFLKMSMGTFLVALVFAWLDGGYEASLALLLFGGIGFPVALLLIYTAISYNVLYSEKEIVMLLPFRKTQNLQWDEVTGATYSKKTGALVIQAPDKTFVVSFFYDGFEQFLEFVRTRVATYQEIES